MKIEILSPDGFSIDMLEHDNMNDAEIALNNFVQRFERQGYYSTVKDGQRVMIPINEIKDYCKIIIN